MSELTTKDLTIIDEVSESPSEWWKNAIINPACPEGRVYVTSTPNGKNPFYEDVTNRVRKPVGFPAGATWTAWGGSLVGDTYHPWLKGVEAHIKMLEGDNSGMHMPDKGKSFNCKECINARKQRAAYTHAKLRQEWNETHPWTNSKEYYQLMLDGDIELPHIIVKGFAGNPLCSTCRKAQRERRRYQHEHAKQ